ncbi:3-isopropylmalate dehydratase [Cupriavidus sp. KK10]|jgi:3-isopropylmalate/(R)-2-methylmalate dehydratase small subunit|uniref:LeuD/DmdB family oxidoreductase small subunit n=1 Tax=Cupriavidus sp. KK10 TaxID=1478019 RepID=UPI001BA90720|nr:3-isopropylmalate dehydratase [Cupriavidus sp. KK10]QUN26075.1 3-isopropylmalate dehydratase [Cupriavidus sp. KK10]
MTSAIAPAPAGRLWRFGDNIDTDAMAPAVLMKSPLPVLARHCLASLRPEFPGSVRAGDVLVAGANFGIGSSREQAPQALRELGVGAVVAQSFGGLFYRNAINLGLPVLVCADTSRLADGAHAVLELASAQLRLDDGSLVACEPIPDFLRAILAAGGLVPHLKARLGKGQADQG